MNNVVKIFETSEVDVNIINNTFSFKAQDGRNIEIELPNEDATVRVTEELTNNGYVNAIGCRFTRIPS